MFCPTDDQETTSDSGQKSTFQSGLVIDVPSIWENALHQPAPETVPAAILTPGASIRADIEPTSSHMATDQVITPNYETDAMPPVADDFDDARTDNRMGSDPKRVRTVKLLSRRWVWISVLLVILAASFFVLPSLSILSILSMGSSFGEVEYPQFVTEEVRLQPFRIAVTERGTVDSMKNATLVNTVEGTTTIIWIAPEGTDVKEGELVCELDSSTLFDRDKQQQIKFTQAEANLKKARENVEIQKTQNESDLAAARLALDLAQLDLEKFKLGDAVQKEAEIQSQITLAQETLNQSRENYEYFARVAKKGYKTVDVVETRRIALKDAELKLAIAQGKLKVQKDYTYERTIKELEEEAVEVVRRLERITRAGIAALVQDEAELKSSELTYSIEKEKLEKLQKQIAACKLVAPQNGKIIYPTEHNHHSQAAVIEEGATVRERQTIIKLPDFSQMKVDARIHESKISQVREGLPVIIKVDALPNETYHGVLKHVSDIPMPGNWPNFDLKEYEAEVRITDEDEQRVRELKPGMTAGLEIVVDEGTEDCLQVPIQAVISVGEKFVAYVLTPNGPKLRNVELGRTNDMAVEIASGLEPGEKVILNPRTHFAEELSDLEMKSGADKRAERRESAKKPDSTALPAQKGRRA